MKPFAWTGLFWLLIVPILNWLVTHDRRAVLWGLIVALVALGSLGSLAGLCDSAIKRAASQPAPWLAFWGLAKVGFLFIFFLIFLRASDIPQPSLIIGVGTAIVVPLIGALWSSLKGYPHA